MALENISNAITTNIPITYFAPACLRYYYDSNGEQQIFSDLETHQFTNRSGEVITKRGEDFKEEMIFKELQNILSLKSLGVPINLIMPVMDHEVLRPEKMNTAENRKKIVKYIQSLKEYVTAIDKSIRVESSLDLFGIPQNHFAFKEILEDINGSKERMFYGENKFEISDKTFEHAVDEVYKRNNQDLERNKYYRSREFARLCVNYGFGENRVHAIGMRKMSKGKGCFITMPYGAELDMLIFNTEKELIVTHNR